MVVLITGPREGKVEFPLQAMVLSAMESFAKQLKIDKLKTVIQIRVHKNILVDKNGSAEGLCECIDKRHFIIDVALYGNWLSTLAHEMVHVKQFARGELNDTLTRWKSKDYTGDKDYWNYPWEVEARSLQYEMVEKFDKGEV